MFIDKIKEYVGLHDHRGRNIVVVKVPSQSAIYIHAVCRNGTELKLNLGHELPITISLNRCARRLNENESSDNAGFGVGNLNRFVGANEYGGTWL